MLEKTDMNEVKKKLEEEMITGIIEYLKHGAEPNNSPSSYMNSYSIVVNIVNKDKEDGGEQLFNYHNEIIESFIKFCYEDISQQSNDLFIDSFIKNTEKINILIYWMRRIFTYLENHYLQKKTTLSKTSMKIYKEKFLFH